MRKLFIALILIVVIGVGIASYAVVGSYSDGFRAGTLIKFSKKGYVFKTYEGQLRPDKIVQDATDTTQSTLANVWDFSVESANDTIVKTIDEALLNGKRIKLHYEEKFLKLPWRGESKYFVYEAEIVE